MSAEDDIKMVQKAVQGLLNKMKDKRKALSIIGEIAQTSIQENFDQEGRPTKWASLSTKTTIPQREASGHWPGKILTRTGSLVRSINYRVGNDAVTIGPNVKYAATMHFGAKKGQFRSSPRPIPWGDIPPRPYMILQKEDWEDMREDLEKFLSRNV